ncbi:isopentenyl-diphosphate Delta-isomerase [Catenovulum sediminis]|uniref:Isopentenyl-diphosphate Delta-isomerase n=1 Tax=Catenovulum sediminis TaxID=1740262 RepID=A0ABV1RI84_9ALTE
MKINNKISKNLVVLVNRNGQPIGVEDKESAHRKGLLHAAFSVFIFNTHGQLLLQQRALTKYHSPGLWSNSCCSHPLYKEKFTAAAKRRLQEELGIQCSLTKVCIKTYKLDVGQSMYEHEYNQIFFGIFNGSPLPCKEEVENWRWVEFDELIRELQSSNENYTSWFAWLCEELSNEVSEFISKIKQKTV